jgi:hypothetical protein
MAKSGFFYYLLNAVSRMSRGASSCRSAVSKSAYLRGEKMYDPRTRTIHDYSHRSDDGEIESKGCEGARPGEDAEDRWQRIAAVETRQNSTECYTIEAAVPAELDTPAIRRELAALHAETLRAMLRVESVDWAVHPPSAGGDPRNFHIHFEFGTRDLEGEKFHTIDENDHRVRTLPRARIAKVARCCAICGRRGRRIATTS